MFSNMELNDPSFMSLCMPVQPAVFPEQFEADSEPHLQAMRYALPHPSQPFCGGDIGVNYFPFESHNWNLDLDVGLPLSDHGLSCHSLSS
jgi:hypothetical protein